MLALTNEPNMDSVIIYKGIWSSDISGIHLELHLNSITQIFGEKLVKSGQTSVLNNITNPKL